MNKYDQLVNDFVLVKFREHWTGFRYGRSLLTGANRRAIEHQLKCSDSVASVKLAEWECGCYSEVTREDMFVVNFIVSCGCGSYYQVNTSLDLQHENLMEQLLEYEDNQCPYEDEDYPY